MLAYLSVFSTRELLRGKCVLIAAIIDSKMRVSLESSGENASDRSMFRRQQYSSIYACKCAREHPIINYNKHKLITCSFNLVFILFSLI